MTIATFAIIFSAVALASSVLTILGLAKLLSSDWFYGGFFREKFLQRLDAELKKRGLTLVLSVEGEFKVIGTRLSRAAYEAEQKWREDVRQFAANFARIVEKLDTAAFSDLGLEKKPEQK